MNIREDVQKDDIMLLDDDVDEEDDWKTRTKKKTGLILFFSHLLVAILDLVFH